MPYSPCLRLHCVCTCLRSFQSLLLYPCIWPALFDKVEFNTEGAKNHLIVAVSSDRGLCGAFHANVSRAVKRVIAGRPSGSDYALVCIGERMKGQLQRLFKDKMIMHFNEFGRQPPVFAEASFVVQQILNSGYEFDTGEIIFNRFR